MLLSFVSPAPSAANHSLGAVLLSYLSPSAANRSLVPERAALLFALLCNHGCAGGDFSNFLLLFLKPPSAAGETESDSNANTVGFTHQHSLHSILHPVLQQDPNLGNLGLYVL